MAVGVIFTNYDNGLVQPWDEEFNFQSLFSIVIIIAAAAENFVSIFCHLESHRICPCKEIS